METPPPDTDTQTTLTIALPIWLAEWVSVTAARRQITPGDVIQEILAQHIIQRNPNVVPNGVSLGFFDSTGAKSIARMNNAIIAAAIDGGHDAVRISYHPNGINVQVGNKDGLPDLAGGKLIMTLPLHIWSWLVMRCNEMAGWSRQTSIRHNDRAYTIELTNQYPEYISLAITPEA